MARRSNGSSYYCCDSNWKSVANCSNAQWFCMCQFENSEKGSQKGLKIQNFDKINCFYDFWTFGPNFGAFLNFLIVFIYKLPYKNFWKKNLGPMSAGNETIVESWLLLSYLSPRKAVTVNGRRCNFFEIFILPYKSLRKLRKSLELVPFGGTLFKYFIIANATIGTPIYQI